MGSEFKNEVGEEILNNTWLMKFKKGKITEEEFEEGLLTSAQGSIRTASMGTLDVEGTADSGASDEERECTPRWQLLTAPFPAIRTSAHGLSFQAGEIGGFSQRD